VIETVGENVRRPPDMHGPLVVGACAGLGADGVFCDAGARQCSPILRSERQSRVLCALVRSAASDARSRR